MDTKKFFMLFMIMFMLFTVSGCGGSGGNTQNLSNDPISPDKPAPAPETKSDDIPLIPVPAPQSQDKPISTEPIPTPTNPIISPDPIPVRYTVSFNSNGGSTVSSITVLSGHTINKPSNPKKYGSTFKGWYKDNALTQIFTFGADGDKVTANITLYAKWIEDSVLAEVAVEKVSIGYQDGDSANHVTKNITLPRNIDVSGDVANIIWSSNNEKVIYTNGTVTRQSTDVTVVLTALSSIGTADKSRVFTLKVIHAETTVPSSYTVSFNSNGGSSVSNITVSSGNTVNKPKDPSKNGYTFGGWYKDSTLTQAFRFGSGGDKITGDITLYAKWIETDRLRAEVAIEKISIGYQDSDSANSVTKNLTLPTLVYVSGDVNVSWSSNAPSVISNSGIVTRPSDNDVVVSLTAKVTVGSEARNKTFTVTVIHKETPAPLGYTVSFDTKGGSTVTSIRVANGGTVEMPENPTLAGYVFAGWYKDEAFTEIFTFGTDGDKISQDITLYARWTKPEELLANYALSEIVIGYSYGNNPNYVTGNITLPSAIDTIGFYGIDSVNISWSSSNPGVISSAGNVTRQNGRDVNVTLKAEIQTENEVFSRDFSVRVVRTTNRNKDDIPHVTVNDIHDMNSGNSEANISYGDDKQVVDIDGTFCGFQIYNAEDAKDAVQGIHEALGINDTYSELVFDGATSMDTGVKYCFVQSYDNAEVYGRRVLVSTNASNNTNFMMSSFLSSDVLASADLSAKITKEQAEGIAKGHYAGSFDVVTDFTHQIIYSLNDYETAPVRALAVKILGISTNGEYLDEDVIVNAINGEIIDTMSNHCDFRLNAKDKNELGDDVDFPIELEYGQVLFTPIPTALEMVNVVANFMHDTEFNVQVYKPFNPITIEAVRDSWDSSQVSAYTNMIDIMRWWRTAFSRNSLDDKGMKVKVVTHATGNNDNASWITGQQGIYIYDNSVSSSFAHSPAAAADLLAHETTHAVVQYGISGGFWDGIAESISSKLGKFPYQNATGAINEAYADIFACMFDSDDWKQGEDWWGNGKCSRNIAEPNDANAHNRLDIQKFFTVGKAYHEYKTVTPSKEDNDHNHVHTYSLIVSHAAYLMHKYGMPYDLLGQLWYSTIYGGAYDAKSNFHSVRNVVLKVAREKPELQSYIGTIERAFDEVGITEGFGLYKTLHITVSDVNDSIVDGFVSVTISRDNEVFSMGKMPSSIMLPEGIYTVKTEAKNYFPSSHTIKITSRDVRLDISLLHLPTNWVSGTIYSSDRVTPLEGAIVSIRAGRDNLNGDVIESQDTNLTGGYGFDLIEYGAGDYTITITKDGYTDYFNVAVKGDVTKNWYFLSDNEPDTPMPVDPDVPSNRYEIFNEATTWYEAKARCEELGGHLATITSEEEYHRVLAMIPPDTYAYYWLGATKDNDSGNWQWITGEPFIFTKWQEGEPNNQGGVEQCLELTNAWSPYEDWGWNDENGDFSATGFVCEWDSTEDEVINYDIPIDEAHFPDAVFRAYVSGQIDTNKDGVLSKVEIYNTTEIDVGIDGFDYEYVSGITSLKGIEYFVALRSLNCLNNKLTTLDVSNNTALLYLCCTNNRLTLLDVSNNINLEQLICPSNQLKTLNVSNNIALKFLYCHRNQLTELDVSKNVKLTTLVCGWNQLTALDVSNNAVLIDLDFEHNQLKTLDVSNNTTLRYLNCSNNQLTTLNVSKNTALHDLYCNNNQLTHLDVSGCPNLYNLNCKFNQLTELDLSQCYSFRGVSRHLVYDTDVVVTWYVAKTTVAALTTLSLDPSVSMNDNAEILAVLPAFTPTQSGIYSFTVSLDRIPPENTSLVLLSDSEDIYGSFALTDSADTVIVSADFTAGRTYAPVIVAMSEGESQSGGCNTENIGIILLAGLIVVVLAKRRDT